MQSAMMDELTRPRAFIVMDKSVRPADRQAFRLAQESKRIFVRSPPESTGNARTQLLYDVGEPPVRWVGQILTLPKHVDVARAQPGTAHMTVGKISQVVVVRPERRDAAAAAAAATDAPARAMHPNARWRRVGSYVEHKGLRELPISNQPSPVLLNGIAPPLSDGHMMDVSAAMTREPSIQDVMECEMLLRRIKDGDTYSCKHTIRLDPSAPRGIYWWREREVIIPDGTTQSERSAADEETLLRELPLYLQDLRDGGTRLDPPHVSAEQPLLFEDATTTGRQTLRGRRFARLAQACRAALSDELFADLMKRSELDDSQELDSYQSTLVLTQSSTAATQDVESQSVGSTAQGRRERGGGEEEEEEEEELYERKSDDQN